MSISTHILDTASGRPASGVPVSLARFDNTEWLLLATSKTDADGRCRDLLNASADLSPGVYRIRFDTGAYYEGISVHGLYPYVEIAFHVLSGQSHYHIPLLLSPNSYTTYRGS